jgi:hypothetical protein
MEVHKELLHKRSYEWVGENDHVVDIRVIGIKV